MLETHLRSSVQPFFNVLGKTLVFFRLTPNLITLLAFITGIFAGGCIGCARLYWALALLLCSGLLDILDGTVARMTNNTQKIGAYYDLVADRMVEAAFIIGFAVLYPQHYLVYLFFFVALLLHFSTFVVAGALFPNMSNKSMHYDKSLVERPEAFFAFSFMLILPNYLHIILGAFSALVFWCGVTRFLRVVEYVNSESAGQQQALIKEDESNFFTFF